MKCGKMRAGGAGRRHLLPSAPRASQPGGGRHPRRPQGRPLRPLVGLLPMLGLLALYGPERGIKAIVFAVPVATFTTGLILGMVRAKQDWK